MNQLNELLEMWKKDSVIDRTEPGKELTNIPQLHSKYLTILSRHRLLSKEAEFKYQKMKKEKYVYYTGKMSKEELDARGWDQFDTLLSKSKVDINLFFDADEDLKRLLGQKIMHDEIVEVCQSIMKELNSRTFQLRDFIQWERFIQGS